MSIEIVISIQNSCIKEVNSIISILIIINDSFKDTYSYLKKNNLEYLNVLVISGSFIEGMYILSQTSGKGENQEALLKVVAGQKTVLNEIIKLAEPVKTNDNVKDMYAQLTALMACYDEVKFTVEPAQFEAIKKKVIEIRKSII